MEVEKQIHDSQGEQVPGDVSELANITLPQLTTKKLTLDSKYFLDKRWSIFK